ATVGFPVIDMVCRGDGIIDAGRRAAPIILVLPEGCRALNGGLVHLLMFVEVVVVSVAADGIDERPTHIAFFADVIFNQRARRPTIDAEVIVGAADESDVVAD